MKTGVTDIYHPVLEPDNKLLPLGNTRQLPSSRVTAVQHQLLTQHLPLKSYTPQNILISPQGQREWDRRWHEIKEGNAFLKNRKKKKTLRNVILCIAYFDNLNSSKRLIKKNSYSLFPWFLALQDNSHILTAPPNTLCISNSMPMLMRFLFNLIFCTLVSFRMEQG